MHRQNAELAKLRQDCVRLNRELNERTAAQHTEEERRKTLETKMSTAEEQLAQTQVSPDSWPFYFIPSLLGDCGLCTMTILFP